MSFNCCDLSHNGMLRALPGNFPPLRTLLVEAREKSSFNHPLNIFQLPWWTSLVNSVFNQTPFLPLVLIKCSNLRDRGSGPHIPWHPAWNHRFYNLLFSRALFQNVDHKTKLRSKKGQLPFVELNGEEIADSAIILKELSQKFGKDVDAGLTYDQKSRSHALIMMIENHFVWWVYSCSSNVSGSLSLVYIPGCRGIGVPALRTPCL